MRRLLALTAFVLVATGALLPAGPAHGAAKKPALQGACPSWFGQFILAVVCDPRERGGERFTLALRGKSARGDDDLGVVQLGGSEPLQEGETLEASMAGGGPGTRLAFLVGAGGRTTPVVVAPFAPSGRYAVTVEGLVVRVRSAEGAERTFPVPGPPASRAPVPPVRSGTPAETIRSYVRLQAGSVADHAVACTLLTADAEAAYTDPIRWDGEVDTCADVLHQGTHPANEPPFLRGTVAAVRVLRRAGMTVARVRLAYRFGARGRTPAQRVAATADVPLVREPGGWRIADPWWLEPWLARKGGRPSDALLRRGVAAIARQARKVRLHQLQERTLPAPVGTAVTPCAGPLTAVTDRPLDVSLANGGDRAGRQDAAGIDVVAVRHGRTPLPCFAVDVRTPLPEQVTVELAVEGETRDSAATGAGGRDELEVRVAGATAVGVVEDRENGDPPLLYAAQVDVAPDRRSLTVRPDPAGLGRTVLLTRDYRWTLALFAPVPAWGGTYMDTVPDPAYEEPDRPHEPFPAPPLG